MVINKYTCDRCQAEARYWIRPRIYQLADDITCTLSDERVWCYDCNTLRSAESFPSADFLNELIEILRSGELPTWEVEYLSILERSKDEWIAELLKEAVVRLRWLETRQSPPRCLECGSTNFVHLPERPKVVDNLFEHPGCGGTFHLTVQTFAREIGIPVYDAEGNRLNDF